MFSADQVPPDMVSQTVSLNRAPYYQGQTVRIYQKLYIIRVSQEMKGRFMYPDSVFLQVDQQAGPYVL